jgi:hypothetical protein
MSNRNRRFPFGKPCRCRGAAGDHDFGKILSKTDLLVNSPDCLNFSVLCYNENRENYLFGLKHGGEIRAAMNSFNNVNFVTIFIIFIFIMPVITGVLNPVSKAGIRHSLFSAANALNLILSLFLSVKLVRTVFSDTENGLLKFLDSHIPSVSDLIAQYRYDIAAYIIATFIFITVVYFILELLAIPLCRHVIVPLTDRLSRALDSADFRVRCIFSGLWQLPKSVCVVLVFSLLLNFYSNFINNPAADDYINASKVYQAIHKNILNPVLSADLVKKVPVMVGDALKKAAEDLTPASSGEGEDPNYWKLPAIKYSNGVTIEEGVKSNSEIDAAAKQTVGNETDDVKRARLLYDWVSENIEYDKAKAETVLKNPSLVDSGSIVTFEERTGVCFDYSCLYVSMCRAVGLKVRMVSGLGFNGMEWGEHVWNQVYDPVGDRWINVDPTFGSSGNDYFDNPDFSDNHRYDAVQAEW